MESNDIFVEKNFDNIFIVNPNRVLNQYGNPEDRYIKHEELIYYVNLECELKPRSRLISGDDKGTTLTQIAIGKVNFLKPNDQDYLTTNWTKLQSDVSDPNVINGELLGLKTVTYKVNTSFVPTITITLEDSKGRALMESGDNSIYAAFFNLPYPVFYLTLKGYYGKAIRYPIILQKFNSSFNSSSGNFEITLNFIAYQFNVLTDITMGSLLATPQMYIKRVSEGGSVRSSNNTNASLSQLSPQTQNVGQIIEQKGLKKIKNVYAKYKEKGLIDENVPELTIQELITKLDNFVNYSLAQFGQLSLGPLNDIKEYNTIIDEYRKKILTGKGTSWFNTYLSESNFFIYDNVSGDVNDEDNIGLKIYTYNGKKNNESIIENTDDVNSQKYTALNELESIINEYNDKLLSNPTFGTNGKYFIPVNINLNSVGIKINDGNVNLGKTYELRKGISRANENQKIEIETELNTVNEINNKLNTNNGETTPKKELKYWFFNFDGVNRFNEQLNEIQIKLQQNSQNVEKQLSDELSKFISDASGLGFTPSLKNIMGVILASSEAFLLLLNDVHEAAIDVRNNKKRKGAVKDTDIKNPNDVNAPVYPWPLYVVDKSVNCDQKFQITYPGDPEVISKTRAYDYIIWPEVEFVEEFLKGYTQRKTPAAPESNLEKTNEVKRIMVSAFDTVPSNTPYSNLETVDYFFEVFERVSSIVQYNGFLRKKVTEPKYNGNLIQYLSESEGTNMINSILNLSPDLQLMFSDNGPNFTVDTYQQNLIEITNSGQNTYYYNLLTGVFNTQYLKEKIVDSPNGILQSELPSITITLKGEKSFENYIGSSVHNLKTDYDLMPFTNELWRRQNLPNGTNKFSFNNDFNVTSNSLFYNTYTKKISNYITPLGNRSNNDKDIIKPFTDFKILNNKITNPVTLNDFYKNRTEFILTEGNIYYSSGTQTTSIINTPYFINAVQLGINREISNQSAPYVEAAYLFLNSLPLATLKEKYLSFINSENKVLDFIAPTLTKFAGVHSLPQFWFLKLGSIWHRYKQNIQSNNNFDNLDQIWTDFDVLSNYYPAENPTLSYTYIFTGSNYSYTITCQAEIPSAQGTYNKIDLGFYPKLINEYFYFVNKKLIFPVNSTIETIRQKLNDSIDSGDIVLVNTSGANFGSLSTWSVFVKKQNSDDNTNASKYFIVPSFGTISNELQLKFANSPNSLFNNPSVFNGSVRTLWGGPNYGYFDTNGIKKPTPKQYFKKINTQQSYQQPFELRADNEYSSIEEIFSVFEKSELDLFESLFLEFCETPSTTLNSINFKRIYGDIISGTFKVTGTSNNDIIQTVQNKQIDILNSSIPGKLTINYLYKRSNPNGFDPQSFNYISTIKRYTQTIIVNLYTDNLPPELSYTNSLQQYPNEWLTLQEVVGFSTLNGMSYDTIGGSKITSFFKDFNIEFTVGNINTFSKLIKMYATLKDASNTNQNLSDTFRTNIDNILQNENNLYSEVFEGIMNYLITNLPTSEKNQTQEISTVIDGYQSKVELYDMFKAVNDKWISSNDYNTKTLFEDFLFLDRANRDIGGDVYLDITLVNKYLKNLSPKTNVFTVIDSILKSHHFITFSMPSYINFYNSYVPSKNGTNNEYGQKEFANNLFGTFTNVDYQQTTAKLVSIYSEKPSNQLPVQSSKNGYKDDGLNIDDATNNELRNPCQKDYAKSNKVVGFSVDFELQNQSVFENISVSQELGKATSESLAATDALANQSAGIQTSTQNVSLYNIYKDRSYSCTVDGFGNAMIQPTMYFILRNVPLFAGSYYITEVTHTVTLDSFKTSFTGTRQSKYTLPKVENTFQTLKTQLLSTVNSNLKNSKTTVGASQTLNKTAIKSLMVSNINGNEALNSSNLCSSVLYSDFAEYQAYTQNAVTKTESEIHKLVNNNIDNPLSFYTVIAIFTIASQFDTLPNASLPAHGFKYIGNNLADISLEYPIYGELKQYLSPEFTCLTGSDNKNRPYAVFNSTEDCVSFIDKRYSSFFKNAVPTFNTVSDLIDTVENYNPVQTLEFKEKIAKVWIEHFPYTKINDYPNIYEDFKTTNKTEYEKLLSKIPTDFYI
jgi:hypothetical protein